MNTIEMAVHGKFKVAVCQVLSLLLFLLCVSTGAEAQKGLPDDEAKKLESVLSTASNGSVDEQIKALSEAAALMRQYAEGDPNLQAVTGLLEFERDRLEILGNKFEALVEKIKTEKDPNARRLALRELRQSLLWPATYMMQLLAEDGITAKEAGKLLKLAEAVSKAVDDLKDAREFSEKASLTGSTSSLTRFLTVAKGIANFIAVTSDPDANKAMSTFRDLIGSIDLKVKGLGVKTVNPLKAFEYPAAVTAAQLQVVNEGFEAATESMNLVGDLIENDDPATRRQLNESIEKVKKTLSQKNFGNAMKDAIVDRFVSKLPLLRSLINWYGDGGSEFCELRKTGTITKTFGPLSRVQCKVFDALGKALAPWKRNEYKQVKLHPSAVEYREKTGYYGINNDLCSGSMDVWAGTWSISWGNDYFNPPLSCGNLTFEPYAAYELIVKGTNYGRLVLVTPEGSDSYSYQFSVLSSDGYLVTSVYPNQKTHSYSDIPPGKYTIKYGGDPNPYYGIPVAIKNAKYSDVEIKAGKVTTLVLPKLRCKNSYDRECKGR